LRSIGAVIAGADVRQSRQKRSEFRGLTRHVTGRRPGSLARAACRRPPAGLLATRSRFLGGPVRHRLRRRATTAAPVVVIAALTADTAWSQCTVERHYVEVVLDDTGTIQATGQKRAR
jgi:hypothetical protein